MIKTVKIEVVDYLSRAYLNKVARILSRSIRNFQVSEGKTESYGLGDYINATTLEVTNNGYTTFSMRDWELELKELFKAVDNLDDGIVYLNTGEDLIELNVLYDKKEKT